MNKTKKKIKFNVCLTLFALASAASLGGCNSSTQATPQSGSNPGALTPSQTLLFNLASLQVQFGSYTETEFTLPQNDGSPVNWQISDGSLPPGLQLRDNHSRVLVVSGNPQFTDRWCLAITGTSANGFRAGNEICYVSLDNPNLNYPKISTERNLPLAHLGIAYNATIQINNANGSVAGQIYDSALPEGIQFSQEAGAKFYLNGTPAQLGNYPLTFGVSDGSGNYAYKQFELIVTDSIENNPVAQCPPGYFFDPTLNYCVQSVSTTCAPGTYYDPSANSCVAYPAPPPTITCGPGTHFDPFTSQCVESDSYRCPLNYSWDSYYHRCVRESFTCNYGERYDWYTHECVVVYQSCPSGTHYDPYSSSCVVNPNACPWGSYYDPYSRSCVVSGRYCGDGNWWDPDEAGCRPYQHRCEGGEIYQPGRGCIPVVYVPTCGYGSHYSPERGNCVPNYERPEHPPVVIVPPGHIPTPPPRPVPTVVVPPGNHPFPNPPSQPPYQPPYQPQPHPEPTHHNSPPQHEPPHGNPPVIVVPPGHHAYPNPPHGPHHHEAESI